jgi:predicted O-linked N-acetylglucosamine transferase (SPINDLY family)
MQEPAAAKSAALPHRRAAAALRAENRLAEAVAELQQAVALAPDDPDVQGELGLTLALAGRFREAEAPLRRAHALAPQDPFVLSNLASVLKQLNQATQAEGLFRQLLAIEPDHVPALRNLAVLLKDAGRFAESRALAERALALEPSLEACLQARLSLTPMLSSRADGAGQRAAYAAGLEALAADPRAFPYRGEKSNLPWYQLAYHAADDRPLLERTAQLVLAKARGPARDLTAGRLAAATGRLRIGFCSEFFHAHTIGRLYRGLVEQLDRRRFEVVVLHGAYAVRDEVRAAFDAAADAAVVLPSDPDAAEALVAELGLDVLFYPDLAMSAQTWFLAGTRLAPVQATSWGHPNTSGVAAIDYFVSADAIEPDGADAAYSECLVRLGRLPSCYAAPGPPAAVARADLRLPATGTLYGCPQTLFKFHPDFDAVLARIAEGDPDGHIILVDSRIAAWREALTARWAQHHPRLNERVTFLPRLSHEGFMAHLAHIDVLLDPPHFGSGNTLYEGVALGTPIVTWPAGFMRGRIVAAAYRQMGIADPPIAETLDDYADLALALGRDVPRRMRLQAELRAKSRDGLYGDREAVRQFEAFLEAAALAAARGERLPPGWRSTARETKA